jgi:hypothetical protein
MRKYSQRYNQYRLSYQEDLQQYYEQAFRMLRQAESALQGTDRTLESIKIILNDMGIHCEEVKAAKRLVSKDNGGGKLR